MYTACHQVQFMKKRFEEELKKVDFGAKKWPTCPILDIFLKCP